jgi:hypothetical protein
MVHHALVPLTGEQRLLLEVNSDKNWDIAFANGFEGGDTSEWSDVQP